VSKQEPTFYDLESTPDAAFWGEESATLRRTFVMPLSSASGFLAFGAVHPWGLVRFVARGLVEEHLGDFIARMVGAGSSVELFTKPPVPMSLLMKHASSPPLEVQVITPPPPPKEQPLDRATILATLWREGDGSTRHAYVVPLSVTTEFLVFGVLEPMGIVHFVARGSVAEDLGPLIARMKHDEARVTLVAHPPLPKELVKEYVQGRADKPQVLVSALARGAPHALREGADCEAPRR
jgi:hypothetical protein